MKCETRVSRRAAALLRIPSLGRSACPGKLTAGRSKRPSSKAAASEEARRTLRYVEPLSEVRTKLADFFSVLLLLEVHPELRISPTLIGAGAQVLRNIPAGEEVRIGRLEGHLAIHEHVRPYDIQLVADVPLGVVRF